MTTAIIDRVEQIVKGMEPVSLSEMDHVKLMQRSDRKYVVPADRLPHLLVQVENKYRVLKIEDTLLHPYETIYYDTPSFSMYHDHHNRRLNRYKVRIRTYRATDVRYLEVKFKSNKGITTKKRIIPENGGIRGLDSERFLREKSPYSSQQIVPTLQNSFYRITLVHKLCPERITIDLGLAFGKVGLTERREMPRISIIEIKRGPDSGFSEMTDLLRKHRINPMGFSKYCIGTALIHTGVRINLFKTKLRRIGKMDEHISAMIN